MIICKTPQELEVLFQKVIMIEPFFCLIVCFKHFFFIYCLLSLTVTLPCKVCRVDDNYNSVSVQECVLLI